MPELTFKELKQKVEETEELLNTYKKQLQGVCEHKHIEGYDSCIEYQGYDRDYICGNYQCKDCGLSASEDKEHYMLYKKLEYLKWQNENEIHID